LACSGETWVSLRVYERTEPLMATPRIAPLPEDSEAVQAIGPIAAKGAKGINLMSTILQNKPLYDVWRPLARYLNSSPIISLRDRELIILRVAWLGRSEYIWGNHALVVARSGAVTEPEMLAVRLGSGAPGWTETEAALLRATEEFANASAISEATWEVLRPAYTDAQLAELTLLVGFYWMLVYFANSLDIEPEGVLVPMDDYASLLPVSAPATEQAGA
jgi:4-carboxymuconolactone decarboxylase